MLKNLSLRHIISLLFLTSCLLVVLAFYGISLPSIKKEIVKIGKEETRSLILTHQSQMIDHLLNSDDSLIQNEIFFIGNDPTIKRVLIADNNNKVLYANRTRLIGENLQDINIGLQASDLAVDRTKTIIRSVSDTPNILLAIAPLPFKKEGRDHDFNLIILRDHSSLANSIIKVASAPAELLASAMLLISICVILLLRSHLDKRLTPLISAAARLAKGDTAARAKLKGSDEFAEIGRSFDKMAQQIERSHQELLQAKDDAERTGAAHSQFVGSMSHEIQTPLAGLIGFVELLQETELDEEGRLYVRSANSAARTLSGLLTDLFESSRLENGRRTLSFSTFCLNSLLQDIVDSLLPRILHKGLNIKIEANESDPIWIDTDPRIFRQILINLLGNAVHYTNTGKITVTVHTADTEKSMLKLSISVSDTGIGIAQEDMKFLFNRFYKVSNPKAPLSPGPGVGLSICRELAEMIGGAITAESMLDQGSCFTFTVDVARGQEPKELDLTVFAGKAQEKEHNILVIDNSELIASLLDSILGKWGHSVTACLTGEQAIQQMQRSLIYPNEPGYSIILLDLHLSDMDSFTLAREIKGMDAHSSRVPIIGMSTNATPDSREQCKQAGIQGFITKPIARKHLADEIFRLTRLSPRNK